MKEPIAERETKGRWHPPFWFWMMLIVVASAVLLTDLIVFDGAGGLVIDWKIGPSFIGVIGGIWGARSSRKRRGAAVKGVPEE